MAPKDNLREADEVPVPSSFLALCRYLSRASFSTLLGGDSLTFPSVQLSSPPLHFSRTLLGPRVLSCVVSLVIMPHVHLMVSPGSRNMITVRLEGRSNTDHDELKPVTLR